MFCSRVHYVYVNPLLEVASRYYCTGGVPQARDLSNIFEMTSSSDLTDLKHVIKISKVWRLTLSLLKIGSRKLVAKVSSGKWFFDAPVGVNSLSQIVPEIAKEAQWDSTKLWGGHSSRATAGTALYDTDIPESAIKKVSSHRSDQAVREYERSDKRKRDASRILSTASTSTASVSTVNFDDGFESDETIEYQMVQVAQEMERAQVF